MICVNELSQMKCNKRSILEPLVSLITPFAPHIAEELYHLLGNSGSVCDSKFPTFDEKYLVENTAKYAVSFNGKVRFTMEIALSLSKEEVEKLVLSNEQTQKFTNGQAPKKVIVVPGKIVNIVL